MNQNLEEFEDLKKLLMESDDGNFDQYSKVLEFLGVDVNKLNEDLVSKVKLEYSSDTGKKLSFAYGTDSGFDLYASEEVQLSPFGRALVPTGIRIGIPEGYEIQIRSKSGLAINKGLMVLNSPGTVDQGYTGEIKVIIFNASDLSQTINKGDKIAQAVLSFCTQGKFIDLIKVDKIEDNERKDNGFGSTGI